MSWELKGPPRTVKVTRALARKFRDMIPAPADRNLSDRRLQVYRTLFERGQFRPCTWGEVFCLETQQWYRVNGKHTSTLLSDMDPLPENYHVIVESYECETLEDVSRLYGTFDSKMQSRTTADIYRSFASTVPELQSLSSSNISALVAGINYHHLLEGYWKEQPSDRAERLLDHVPFCIWVSKLLWEGFEERRDEPFYKHRKALSRQAPIAAMLGCWLKDRARALEFWTAVREMSDPDPRNPSRKIAMFLSTALMRGKSGGTASAGGVTAREMYVKCVHAWNAWRRGESTNLNYYRDKEVPSFA